MQQDENERDKQRTQVASKSRQTVYIVKEMTENTPPSWVGGYITNCSLLFYFALEKCLIIGIFPESVPNALSPS